MLNQINQCLTFALFSLLIFPLSCKEPLKDDADYTALHTLHIPDSILTKSLQLPVDGTSLKYVKLESNANSIIARIDQLEIHQDVICILDGINNKLFLFNISGKFIQSLSVRDRQLYQFDVFDDKLYLYENSQGEIYQFSLKGRLLKIFHPGIRGGEFVVLHPGVFAYSTLGLKTDDKNTEAYQLMIFKKPTSQVKLPFKEEYAGLKYYFGNQFSRHDKEINFVTAFSNIVYRIDTSTIKALTKFDFGKYNMPDSVFKSRSSYNDYNRTPYITELVTCASVDSSSVYRFTFRGKEGYMLTDHNRRKFIDGGIGIIAGEESDFNNPMPICSYKNKFVAVVERGGSGSNNNLDNQKQSTPHDQEKPSDFNNPILMFYSLL